MFHALRTNTSEMNGEIEFFNEERNYFKNQIEILELKNTINQT